MSVSEATKTTQFLKWSKARLPHSFVFEAKICKEKSLPFNKVVEHQVNNLYRVKHGIWNFKIPDAGYTNPFDGIQLSQVPAFVVVFWVQKRGDKRFTMIDIDDWLREKDTSDRRSLTYEQSCLIGQCYDL